MCHEIRSERPILGHVRCLLLSAEQSAVALIVNANHALLDGKCMMQFLSHFLCLCSENNNAPDLLSVGGHLSLGPERGICPCPSWGDLIPAESLSKSPEFLPLADIEIDHVTIQDIHNLSHGGSKASEQFCLSTLVNIEAVDFMKVRNRAKELAGHRSCTVTALMVACLQQSFAEAYFKSKAQATKTGESSGVDGNSEFVKESCLVSVSIVADIRPMLTKLRSDSQGDHILTQAIGSVTIGSILSNDPEQANTERIVERACAVAADLGRRVERGEALRQASCLSTGDFENGAPEATFEFSNHGIYQTQSVESEIVLDQRFDGYSGLSICLWSEAGNGRCRMTGSAPQHPGIGALMHRSVELFLKIGE
eukprot:g1891.t1